MTQQAADVPVSYNFINKGAPSALLAAIDSVYGALYREGDECVVVDTGSNDAQFKALKKMLKDFDNLKIIDRRDLSVDYTPIIEEHLGTGFMEEFKEHVGDTRGVLSFSDARNVCLEHSTNDVIIWVDSDDVLIEEQPGMLRSAINQHLGPDGNLDALFLDYHYAHDAEGNCITFQRRERVFRKSKYYWKGHCHETAIPRDQAETQPIGLFENLRSYIKHTDARKPHRISDIRNFAILKRAYDEEVANEDVDPRTVFYLGNACRGLEFFDWAIKYYEAFNQYSGSEDDRFAAMYYVGSMYMHKKMQRPIDAYDTFMECIKIKPNDPRGYYALQHTCLLLERPEESLHWYFTGNNLKIPKTQIMSFDPSAVEYRPHIFAAMAHRKLKNKDGATQAAQKALRARPNSPEAHDVMKNQQAWSGGVHFTECFHSILQSVLPQHRQHIARAITQALPVIPEPMEELGYGRIEGPDPREEKPEIAIWCGRSGEAWGPMSREHGIGGSEKMVILLAEALQKTGLVNVSVYGDIFADERGVLPSGVSWNHFSEFDPERPRHTVVYWRHVEAALQVKCPAQKRVLWLHDVQVPGRYNDDIINTLDFVQFQSDYHVTTLPENFLPKEKIWVARNAIEDPKERGVPRNPKHVFYCSSPDRGLMTAARIVAEAQKTDPEIRLITTYGITPWARKAYASTNHRHIPDVGHEMSVDLYEKELFRWLDRIQAVTLGRVGWGKMEILQQQCGVWLYATAFPEISCMSAMEAQANGMNVVATRNHALAETLFSGRELPPVPKLGATDDYVKKCAKILLEAIGDTSDKSEAQAEAIARYNIDDLAQDWLKKLGLAPAEISAATADGETA